jgi:hypothetical protein
MKNIFRFLGLMAIACMVAFLISCNPQANNSTAPASPAATSSSSPMSSQAPGGKPQININTALLSELDKLEAKLGIPALSNKIQGSRPYANTQELVTKQIISQEQFDQVKDLVTIETVVLTGKAKDIDYMVKLGLMEGHLLVAKELLDLQKLDQAEPHIGHPVEEIYADVEDQLKERGVAEFKTTLGKLQDLVKAGKVVPEIATEFTTSMAAVNGAIAKLPPEELQDPKFVLPVINGLLDTANSEYGAAIADGKVKEIVEYQDSRGFVVYASTLYEQISPMMVKSYAKNHELIEPALAKLKPTWPTAIAPANAVTSPAEVTKMIKSIEEASNGL